MCQVEIENVLTPLLEKPNDRPEPRPTMRKPYLLTVPFAAAALTAVQADIIPTLSSASPIGSNFTWNYSTNVTVDQMVRQGDFFTIYDFGNFNAGSNIQPANWAF